MSGEEVRGVEPLIDVTSLARGLAMSALPGLAPYLVLIAAGFLPNEVWRMLGIVVAHGLDEGSEFVVWVRAVATGLLAGVVCFSR